MLDSVYLPSSAQLRAAGGVSCKYPCTCCNYALTALCGWLKKTSANCCTLWAGLPVKHIQCMINQQYIIDGGWRIGVAEIFDSLLWKMDENGPSNLMSCIYDCGVP
jgi:hypothetical protein